jgi:hypothetical protein
MILSLNFIINKDNDIGQVKLFSSSEAQEAEEILRDHSSKME